MIHAICDVCHMNNFMRIYWEITKSYAMRKMGTSSQYHWLKCSARGCWFVTGEKFKKKYILWTKHKIDVQMAVQTLIACMFNAIEFLLNEMAMSAFEESVDTKDFIKTIDVIFVLYNSRNPFVNSTKAPMSKENLSNCLATCQDIAKFIFPLKYENGNTWELVTGRQLSRNSNSA